MKQILKLLGSLLAIVALIVAIIVLPDIIFNPGPTPIDPEEVGYSELLKRFKDEWEGKEWNDTLYNQQTFSIDAHYRKSKNHGNQAEKHKDDALNSLTVTVINDVLCPALKKQFKNPECDHEIVRKNWNALKMLTDKIGMSDSYSDELSSVRKQGYMYYNIRSFIIHYLEKLNDVSVEPDYDAETNSWTNFKDKQLLQPVEKKYKNEKITTNWLITKQNEYKEKLESNYFSGNIGKINYLKDGLDKKVDDCVKGLEDVYYTELLKQIHSHFTAIIKSGNANKTEGDKLQSAIEEFITQVKHDKHDKALGELNELLLSFESN